MYGECQELLQMLGVPYIFALSYSMSSLYAEAAVTAQSSSEEHQFPSHEMCRECHELLQMFGVPYIFARSHSLSSLFAEVAVTA